MMSSLAWAQASAPAGPGLLEQFLPFVLIFVIFYFLLIRPQQKRAKSHQEFLKTMKRGDQVLTSGGILGSIEGLTDEFVTLGISDGVSVRILRSQIASSAQTKGGEKK